MSKKIVKIVVHYSDGSVEDMTTDSPFQPSQPTYPIPPHFPGYPISKCSKCGIELKGVMGYCCSHRDCPTGMGPTVC
jgi:hypothetical protein